MDRQILHDSFLDPEHEDTLKPPLVFFDTSGLEYFERTDSNDPSDDEGSKFNENEADVVSRWVNKLVSLGNPVITVIQPNQRLQQESLLVK